LNPHRKAESDLELGLAVLVLHDREEIPAVLLVEPHDPRVLGELNEEDLLAGLAVGADDRVSHDWVVLPGVDQGVPVVKLLELLAVGGGDLVDGRRLVRGRLGGARVGVERAELACERRVLVLVKILVAEEDDLDEGYEGVAGVIYAEA
jgi:hypothetical protein